MKSNDFAAVGFIEGILEPEFMLVGGVEIQTIAFSLITQDGLRFECETTNREIAFEKLQETTVGRSLSQYLRYRCKGYFQQVEGHQVFIVEDLNPSTSVSQETEVSAGVARSARQREQPLPPVSELERRAEQDTRNLKKVECEALLAHYSERDIRHYALALFMSQRFQMPIPIAKNWVECREGHVFWVGTPGMLFRNRKTYCSDCGRDVTVTLTPAPERTKEQRVHADERAKNALERLKRKGWKAND